MRQRGYNQAECFARALSEKTGIRMAKGLVRRVKIPVHSRQWGMLNAEIVSRGLFKWRIVLYNMTKY